MKLFLRKISLFVLPVLVSLFCVEYAIRSLPNSFKLKNEFIENSGGEIETLILGSSHTFYGLNPKCFQSKTFNFANISQSPDVDLAILKSYEDELINLKTVVIRLSYDTLFEQLKNSSEDWRLKDYKLYTDVNFEYLLKHNSEILSIGTRQVLKVLKNNYVDEESLLNCDSLGWGNDLINKPKLDLKNVGPIAAKRHTASSWELLEKNIVEFENLITRCKTKSIKVILITPPSYNSYYNNLDKSQLKKMYKVGRELSDNYSNCYYYDFLKSEDFKEDDFYDADHLNASGTKKFSSIVNSLIEN